MNGLGSTAPIHPLRISLRINLRELILLILEKCGLKETLVAAKKLTATSQCQMGMGIGSGFQARDSGSDSEFTTEWRDTESTTFPSLDNCHQTVTVVSSSVMPLMTT